MSQDRSETASLAHGGNRLLLRIAAGIALACVVGCGNQTPGSESFSSVPTSDKSSGAEVGSVGFDLDIGNSKIDTLRYNISGDHFAKTGTIDVSHSPRVSAVIGGVPFGSGYTVTLTEENVQAVKLDCHGSANFDIASSNVTPVDVQITCQELLAVPVPRGAVLALGAIFLASGMILLRGEGRRRLSRA